jgi:hypothetical protein
MLVMLCRRTMRQRTNEISISWFTWALPEVYTRKARRGNPVLWNHLGARTYKRLWNLTICMFWPNQGWRGSILAYFFGCKCSRLHGFERRLQGPLILELGIWAMPQKSAYHPRWNLHGSGVGWRWVGCVFLMVKTNNHSLAHKIQAR